MLVDEEKLVKSWVPQIVFTLVFRINLNKTLGGAVQNF
jgi:hypothetical protein